MGGGGWRQLQTDAGQLISSQPAAAAVTDTYLHHTACCQSSDGELAVICRKTASALRLPPSRLPAGQVASPSPVISMSTS